jgi:Fe2+ or Zn2+ uptake regulation protein
MGGSVEAAAGWPPAGWLPAGVTLRPVPHDDVEQIIARLRQRGGRATGTRRATVSVLLRAGANHMSAEDITAQVQAEHPDVAASTIYRTLTALEELGVVEHVHLGHGPSTYHLVSDPHQHLVCEDCGAVIEVPDEAFDELAGVVQDRYGFHLHLRHFALLGRCQACQRRLPLNGSAR